MILITGGAGYIGRNIARAIQKDVLLLDDFRATPRAAAHPWPVLDASLESANADWSRITSVVHCAGSILVSESIEKPALYWRNNVGAAAAFFSNAPKSTHIVYSSTAAVYGEPACSPIPETHALRPITPYGTSKLACETMLHDLGFPLTVFRFFNACGGDEDHQPESHLIPRLVRAGLTGGTVTLYGDGSQVRDFVHVEDLAKAHLLALEGALGTFNLGSGIGTTVKEVLETAERVLGKKINIHQEAPRPCDPRVLVADISRARSVLGWIPRWKLPEIIDSTRQWLLSHPAGY